MSSFTKKIAKQIFFKIYDKKLPEPTREEQHYMNEFKERMQSLVNEFEDQNAVPEWKVYSKKILDLTLKDDVRRFLRWKPIQESMNVSFAIFLKKELKFLKNNNWDVRWKKAIKENSFGSPIPFIYYKKSSGNLIHHAYHIAKFEKMMEMSVNNLDYVVEFGAGYGSMCRLFRQLGFKGKYVLFDLPYFSLLQSFYLNGIGLKGTCISDMNELKQIISNEVNENSMFLSTWALSETPVSLRDKLIDSYQKFSYFLFAYQDNFSGNDNKEYFTKLSSNIIVNWKHFKIEHMSDSSYLFGKR